MKKFILSFALFGFFFGTSSCGSSAQEMDVSPCLQAHAVGEETFTISDCIEKDWVSLLVLTPYSDPAAELRRFGIRAPSGLSSHHVKHREEYCVLVFIVEQEVLAWATVPRHQLDFTPVPPKLILKEEALFKLRPDVENGWPFVYLADQDGPVEASNTD